MLIRTWNLFHGNTDPPGRRSHLEEMVRLVTADRPDIVLLQELPAWSLEHLGAWSRMTAVGDVAQRPRFGPVPIRAGVGRALTSLAPGLLRSAFAGQGNAILLRAGLTVVSHEVVALNPARYRREVGDRLGLDVVLRLAWAKEQRVCQIVRLEPRMLVANLHATSLAGDRRVAAAEVTRATGAVLERAAEGDTLVIGGDFNLTASDAAIPGFSAPGRGIDHVLVRGAGASAPHTWPDADRTREGMLLSDHAPVEVEI